MLIKKKQSRKNFRIQRAPFVETKSRTTEDAVAGTTFPNPLTTDHAIPRDDAFFNSDVRMPAALASLTLVPWASVKHHYD